MPELTPEGFLSLDIDQLRHDVASTIASHDYLLQQAIREAVSAADRIILDASDGSVEETNWLTAMVAHEFSNKVLIALNSPLLRRMVRE